MCRPLNRNNGSNRIIHILLALLFVHELFMQSLDFVLSIYSYILTLNVRQCECIQYCARAHFSKAKTKTANGKSGLDQNKNGNKTHMCTH